jgi:Adenylosuccinate synthetase
MFRNVLRSSAATNAFMAGAAAVTGSAFLSTHQRETTTCADNTVVGILQGIATKVGNIEAILGGVDGKIPVKKPGIDVVLGSQWGDEGKGKLVDILSQVCF